MRPLSGKGLTLRKVIAFYLGALCLYLMIFGEYIFASVAYPEWLIAPVMAVGSFVAGSTFLGGGAVAFPALTKLFNTDPFIAKTFSLAIQSAGMSAASLYILYKVTGLPYRFIALYLSGALFGISITLSFFDGLFASTDIRIGFSLFVLCFFIVYLMTHKTTEDEPSSSEDAQSAPFPIERQHVPLIISCGVLGGAISGLLGSGADLVCFCVLALFYRMDIRLATQTSVIIMASVSIFGISFQAMVLDNIPAQVLNLWLVAAPVVVLGAPLGAIICKYASAAFLFRFVSIIIALEVGSTLLLVRLESGKILYYLAILCLVPMLLRYLYTRAPGYERHADSTKDRLRRGLPERLSIGKSECEAALPPPPSVSD